MDLRILGSFAGAAVASVAGVMLGGALRPQVFELQGGPQTMAGQAGARLPAASGDVDTYANYPDKLPDYVLGTDVTRPGLLDAPPPEGEAEALAADPPAPRSAAREPSLAPTQPQAFPSMSEEEMLEQDIPPPPPPPDDGSGT